MLGPLLYKDSTIKTFLTDNFLLQTETAKEIYEKAREMISSPDFSARNIMRNTRRIAW